MKLHASSGAQLTTRNLAPASLYGSERVVVACLALACAASGSIGVLSSHNWGGDFAMYIMQARNIAIGVPQAAHGYVFAPEAASYGPQLYPVGFPLFLSLVYSLFGNRIEAFIWAVSLQYALLAGLLVYFYRDQLRSTPSAFLCAFAFAYCPLLIAYKANVLPHVQYTILCIVALWVLNHWRTSRRIYAGVAAGVSIGLAISTRTVGVALLAALILYDGIQLLRKQYALRDLVAMLIVAFVAVAVWTLLRTVLFPTEGLDSYKALLVEAKWSEILLTNAAYYLGGGIAHSLVDHPSINLALQGIYIIVVLVSIAGAFLKVRSQGLSHIEPFVAASLGILLLFPFRQGIPYLYPLLPIVVLYGWRAINSLLHTNLSVLRRVNHRTAPIFLVAILVALYAGPLAWLHVNRVRTLEGPQLGHAVEAFSNVSGLSADTLVSFRKPRVLALYSDRRSIADPPYEDAKEISLYLSKYGVRHVLVDARLTREAIALHASSHGRLIWRNSRFSLYDLSVVAH